MILALALSAALLNSDVRSDTINQTICVTGYTETVRPATSYTNAIKFRLMREAGIDQAQSKDYALDHIVPLVLGGHPRSLDNLELLTEHDNARKSRVEVKLRCLVCSGQVPLEEAQEAIYDNWREAYHRYASEKCDRR